MENRRQAIVDLVEQMGEVSIKDLRELFPTVSEVTLRKDLRSLDEEKKLVRVHGGAKSILDIAGIGNSFSNRKSLHQMEKSLIGKKAAELLENTGGSIYISSGTTCVELAKNLPQRPMYVFTDGVLVAMDVPTTPDIHIELLGGTLDRNIMRLKGPMVLSALEDLRFDWAFIGTPGFQSGLFLQYADHSCDHEQGHRTFGQGRGADGLLQGELRPHAPEHSAAGRGLCGIRRQSAGGYSKGPGGKRHYGAVTGE